MTIGEAVEALKAGKRVSRAGWGRTRDGGAKHLELLERVARAPCDRWVDDLRIVALFDGERFYPWCCSQVDLLADDWSEI